MKFIGVKKTYVEVNTDTDVNGHQSPRYIMWRDGRKLKIDKVRSIVPAASLKAGGAGLRYAIDINGERTYLFQEEVGASDLTATTRWFVEEKVFANNEE